MAESKRCFVISPIGAAGTEVRARADEVLAILKDTLQEHGYSAERADELQEPGVITNQIVERIVHDPLVIADLTDNNANVLYELAIRHAAQKPVIHIRENTVGIPFDVSPMRLLTLDHRSYSAITRFKQELGKQVRFVEEGKWTPQDPVAMTLTADLLRESSTPIEQVLGQLVEQVQVLSRHVARPTTILAPITRDDFEAIQDEVTRIDRLLRELFEELDRLPQDAVSPALISQQHTLMENMAALFEAAKLFKQPDGQERGIKAALRRARTFG